MRPVILHIITALHTGGAERILAGLSHAWADRAELHIAYLKPVETTKPLFHAGVQWHYVGLGLGTYGRLRRLIRQVRPGVVHTHLSHADLLGLPAAAAEGVPTWCTLHNVSLRPGRMDDAIWSAYRLVLGRMAPRVQVVAISGTVAAHARERLGLAEDRVHLCYNPLTLPVPLMARAEARQLLGIVPEARVLVALGRLEPQKNLGTLLAAFKGMPPEGRPLVYLVGEGSLRAALEGQVAELGLGDYVTFTGLSSEPGLYLCAADALILPSIFEGLGNVLLEAMACGTPVLASRIEGPAEIVRDGLEGFLFDPRSEQDIQKIILRFFDLKVDERVAMEQAALAKAASWPTAIHYADAVWGLYGSM